MLSLGWWKNQLFSHPNARIASLIVGLTLRRDSQRHSTPGHSHRHCGFNHVCDLRTIYHDNGPNNPAGTFAASTPAEIAG